MGMFNNRKRWRVPAGVEPTALDRKVMAFESRGALVPKRSLIRTPEEIEGIRKSGVINIGALSGASNAFCGLYSNKTTTTFSEIVIAAK